jgi:hypothetical protein
VKPGLCLPLKAETSMSWNTCTISPFAALSQALDSFALALWGGHAFHVLG